MIYKMFAVYDVAVAAFNVPFTMVTRAEAIRAFTATANDPQTNINKFPNDYVLYQVGEYDNQSAVVTENIMKLGSANEFLEVDQQTLELVAEGAN